MSAFQSMINQLQLKYKPEKARSSKFTILLIGNSKFCNLMSDAIFLINKRSYKLDLEIAKTEDVETVISSEVFDIHVDVIVLLVNLQADQFLEYISRNISLVEPIYFCDRTLLINGTRRPDIVNMKKKIEELSEFGNKYGLPVFHGNIEDEESCSRIAKRIINYIVPVCGLKTGMPISLHFPVNKFPVE